MMPTQLKIQQGMLLPGLLQSTMACCHSNDPKQVDMTATNLHVALWRQFTLRGPDWLPEAAFTGFACRCCRR